MVRLWERNGSHLRTSAINNEAESG